MMQEIKPSEINGNFIKLIGSDWMLITSGNTGDYNMMTASWGGVGFLWARPVVTVYVRPERFTHGYIERTGRFTLTFFPEDKRKDLAVMGKESGRTFDKKHYLGLTAVELPSGQVTFDHARIVLDCEVIFKDTMSPGKFVDREPLEKWYNDEPGGGLHDIYIAEIKHAWIKTGD